MVTVYSKPGCVQCNFTKKFLDNAGIDYTSVDVMADEKGMEEVKSLGFMALPVVTIEGQEPFSGYRPDKLEALLEEA